MSASVKQANIIDKLLIVPHLLRVFAAIVIRCVSYLGSERVQKPFKDIVLAALRQNLSSISNVQEQWLVATSSQDVYLDFMRKNSLPAESTQLASGLRLHWLGAKTSEKIVLFFHGGGYALPCTEGHLKWLYHLQVELSKTKSTSVVLVGYTLTPQATYPQQLQQAAESLNWVIGKHGKSPKDVTLMGDSAGGNMTVALISHILNPHPHVDKIKLSEPISSAVLISPWVSFSTSDDSYKRNARTDLLTPAAVRRWSTRFLGAKKSDEYGEPIIADIEWFRGLDQVVQNVLVWGGSAEVFIDAIQKFGSNLKKVHSDVEVVVQSGAVHDDFIMEAILGYDLKHEATSLIESWLAARM